MIYTLHSPFREKQKKTETATNSDCIVTSILASNYFITVDYGNVNVLILLNATHSFITHVYNCVWYASDFVVMFICACHNSYVCLCLCVYETHDVCLTVGKWYLVNAHQQYALLNKNTFDC